MIDKIYHNPELQQVNVLDERFYTPDAGKTFHPSVTTILNVYPKGEGFETWLKDVGNNAKEIANRSAEKGTIVHNATEEMNNGVEISMFDKKGNPNFKLDEWVMIHKYWLFWKAVNPVLIANEHPFCSNDLKYGGTIDRVVEIEGRRWLIDIKTSNYLHTSYELQQAAYAVAWNIENPEMEIDQTGIIWLKASTRTAKIDHAKGIYQGKGWQLKTFKRHYKEAYKLFQYTYALWKEEHPNYIPANKIYPDRLKL